MEPLSWSQEIYGNTLAEWGWAALVGVLVMVGVWLGLRLVLARVRAISRRTQTDLDDLVVDLLGRTKLLFVLLVGVWAASVPLALDPLLERWIRAVLVVGLLLQAGFWGTAGINYALERYRRRQLELDPSGATAVGALSFIARLLLWTVVVLTALANVGVDITAFIASLGIGGIAVALALQSVLSDLFASLSIVLDKPFVVGDFIIVGDYMGTVEHVGLKTTRIRSLSGEQLVFSNSDLLGSRIRNYKRMEERRALFTLGVTYDTGYERLRQIPGMIREAVESEENTRFDRAHFKEYGGSALVFETVYYMLVPDYNAYMDTQQAINLEIYRRFEAEGIEFAFPTRTVHMHTAEPS